MKKLFFIVIVLLATVRVYGVLNYSTCTWRSDYTTATVKCELCGETTVYFNSYVYHSYDYTPVRFYDNPDGWIKEYDNYYHKDCWQKFQKFLIELYKGRDYICTVNIATSTRKLAFSTCTITETIWDFDCEAHRKKNKDTK